jgi:hypothetical protein
MRTGRAIAQAGFPQRRPGFKPGSSHVRFCDGQKWCWGRFSPSTSVSLANLHSTNFSTSTITYHPGLVHRPVVAAVPKVPPHKLKKKVWRRNIPSQTISVSNPICSGTGFLWELRFLLPIYIPSASPQASSLSPEAGTIGQGDRSANSLTNQIKIYYLLLHSQCKGRVQDR